MKMAPEQYTELKADLKTLIALVVFPPDALERAKDSTGKLPIRVMWHFFHEVNAQRSYGDDHPRWLTRKRVLEPSHVGGQAWITELYETLNDSHLETALKKAFSELTYRGLPMTTPEQKAEAFALRVAKVAGES